MAAVERARVARGAERIAAAEEALMLRGSDLLPGAYVQRTVIGKKIELHRCLAEPHWERASGWLEALSRDVMGILARAYRDAARHEDALAMYLRVIADDPLDRGAHEGLLVAVSGTGDAAQLHEAWQQICVCLDDEGDPETRGLYERLARELERASNGERTGTGVGASSGSRSDVSEALGRAIRGVG